HRAILVMLRIEDGEMAPLRYTKSPGQRTAPARAPVLPSEIYVPLRIHGLRVIGRAFRAGGRLGLHRLVVVMLLLFGLRLRRRGAFMAAARRRALRDWGRGCGRHVLSDDRCRSHH